MALKSGPKFEEKLICCFKNEKKMVNFESLFPQRQSGQRMVNILLMFNINPICKRWFRG